MHLKPPYSERREAEERRMRIIKAKLKKSEKPANDTPYIADGAKMKPGHEVVTPV